MMHHVRPAEQSESRASSLSVLNKGGMACRCPNNRWPMLVTGPGLAAYAVQTRPYQNRTSPCLSAVLPAPLCHPAHTVHHPSLASTSTSSHPIPSRSALPLPSLVQVVLRGNRHRLSEVSIAISHTSRTRKTVVSVVSSTVHIAVVGVCIGELGSSLERYRGNFTARLPASASAPSIPRDSISPRPLDPSAHYQKPIYPSSRRPLILHLRGMPPTTRSFLGYLPSSRPGKHQSGSQTIRSSQSPVFCFCFVLPHNTDLHTTHSATLLHSSC